MTLATRVLQFWEVPRVGRIGADQVNAVRKATPAVVIANFVNASIIVVGFWGWASWQPLVLWYVATCMLCVYSAYKWRNGRDYVAYVPTRRRLFKAALSSAMFGLPWGFLSVFYLGAMPSHCELLLVTVAAGMAGGGSIYLAPMFPAAMTYLIAVLGPIIIKAVYLFGAGYGFFGLLALSYGAFLWSVICWSAKQHLERSETNTVLRDKTTLLQAIVDNFPGGISFLDHALRIVVCNETAKSLLGLKGQLFEKGPPFLQDLHRDEQGETAGHVGEHIEMQAARAMKREACHFEQELSNGTFLDVRGLPVAGGGFLTIYMDITQRRTSEEAIRHMARHDALTGLPNRFVFRERLEKALLGSRQGDRNIAVVAIDLDRFKEINDTLGHPVGDRVLVEVAARIGKCIREGDTLARLGGDEFSILQSVSSAARDSAALATRIQTALGSPIDLGEHTVSVDASLGIAISPGDGQSMEDLIKKADLALLAAKASGRNQFRYFEPTMDFALRRRRAIEQGLRSALKIGDFELAYQPILNLKSNEIICAEALLRWNSEELGQVSPAEFIPLAEETGLIVPIGRWAISEACRQAASWPDHVKVAVNLSPVQFKDPLLVEMIATVMSTTGLPADRLELEVTETAMLSEADGTFVKLKKLHELGVRIALDDFGTGHSSIANLKRFPFDKIKIDRAFVCDLSPTDPYGLTFVRMIAELGAHLGIDTTAEGVETVQQLEIVKGSGCTEIQGYLVSRPVEASCIQSQFLAREAALSSAA